VDDDGAHQIDPATAKFTVKFNLAKFDPLILADISTITTTKTLTLEGTKIRLWPHYIDDTFPYVDLVQDVDPDNNTSTLDAIPVPTDGKTYIFNNQPLAFSNTPTAASHGQLPKRDVDGLLQFELRYHAFGVKDSDGIEWVIKNGLYHGEDSIPEFDSITKAATGKGTEKGSYILVKFGKGSPEEKQGTTTIAIPIGGS
jgi:hypothetical protein